MAVSGMTNTDIAERPIHIHVTQLMKAVNPQEASASRFGSFNAWCRQQRESIVHYLLAQGADVNAQDHRGETALMRAVMAGNNESVELLLSYGATLEQKDRWGDTALMKAVCLNVKADPLNSINIMNTLLAHGANVHSRNNYGMSPLLRAICNTGYALLDTYNDVYTQREKIRNAWLLHHLLSHDLALALAFVFPDFARRVLCGFNSSKPLPDLVSRDYDRDEQCLKIIKLLVNIGARIDVVDATGKSALMYAAILNMEKTVLFLVSAGIDVRACDNSHYSALDYALYSSHTNLSAILKDEAQKGLDKKSLIFFRLQFVLKRIYSNFRRRSFSISLGGRWGF